MIGKCTNCGEFLPRHPSALTRECQICDACLYDDPKLLDEFHANNMGNEETECIQ